MKKKTLLLATSISTAVIALSTAVIGLRANTFTAMKADSETLSVTFVKGNNQAAFTAKGNKIQLISRYDGDFIFDADDTYLAKTNGETNAFLGLDEDTQIQRIIAFTVVYTSMPDEEHYVCIDLRQSFSWMDTTRGQISNPESGKRYTLDDPGIEYFWCNKDSTFTHFVLQDYCSCAAITSITIEYTCE